jgi:hypothetical protein
MSPLDYPDPAERLEADETDRVLAQLLGDYIVRRENRTTPQVLDLLAAAGEFGDHAIQQMCDLIAFYEAARHTPEVDR